MFLQAQIIFTIGLSLGGDRQAGLPRQLEARLRRSDLNDLLTGFEAQCLFLLFLLLNVRNSLRMMLPSFGFKEDVEAEWFYCIN